MKNIFFFYLLYAVFFTFLAELHSNYLLTEVELMILEKTSEELTECNNQLKTQQNYLKTTITNLELALKDKEALLKDLQASFDAYESEIIKMEHKRIKQIEKLKNTLEKEKKAKRFYRRLFFIFLFIVISFCLFKIWKAIKTFRY